MGRVSAFDLLSTALGLLIDPVDESIEISNALIHFLPHKLVGEPPCSLPEAPAAEKRLPVESSGRLASRTLAARVLVVEGVFGQDGRLARDGLEWVQVEVGGDKGLIRQKIRPQLGFLAPGQLFRRTEPHDAGAHLLLIIIVRIGKVRDDACPVFALLGGLEQHSVTNVARKGAHLGALDLSYWIAEGFGFALSGRRFFRIWVASVVLVIIVDPSPRDIIDPKFII